MQKLFMFFLVLIAIWAVRRGLQAAAKRQKMDQSSLPAEDVSAAPRSETMRECAHCSVLVPESEAVLRAGAFYCSTEHARVAGHS